MVVKMELKEIIQDALNEIKTLEETQQNKLPKEQKPAESVLLQDLKEEDNKEEVKTAKISQDLSQTKPVLGQEEKSKEEIFLKELWQKLLVLFEGLCSKETKELDKKLDLVINFLQYLLAKTQSRIEELEENSK